MRCRTILIFTLVNVCAFLSVTPAHAVITAITPLKQVIDGAPQIFMAKVKEVLPNKPALVMVHDENLKGDGLFGRMPVNLKGDGESAKGKHTQIILDRIAADMPILVVISEKEPKRYSAFCYTEGTWFQIEGRVEEQDGKNVVRWAFLHAEPYLRRTFKGGTAELKQIVVDSVKNKKDPPAPNPKEQPGFGPPLKKAQRDANGAGDTLLGVIQLPFIGAIAALAAIFPTVFGGMALLMRRWMVLLTAASLGSIIYTLYFQFPTAIHWTGLTKASALWIVCAVLTAIGALWSAQRYRHALATGNFDEWQPRRIDRIGLLFLMGIGLGVLGFAFFAENESILVSPWSAALIGVVGSTAGAFYVFSNYWRSRTLESPSPLSSSAETIILWSLVSACVSMGAIESGRSSAHQNGATQGDATFVSKGIDRAPSLGPKPVWIFQPDKNGELLSSPCITPRHIVVSVFHNSGFAKRGAVYALNPENGAVRWSFPSDGDDKMLPVFCSPVYADGKIYVGEGFHEHANCRMFCLDEATGKKVWQFETNSHAESTPAVADGLLVFGAGNDGIYVLEANSGKEIWHYTGERGLHVDANPFFADGLIYASSGYSQTHQVNRIFCLDPKSKTEVWGERVEQSAYGSPIVFDGKSFFATGNSTFSERREPAVGHVHCRDAKTGAVIWDAQMPDTVICRPAVDRDYLYVGCWDGNCYALDRRSGERVWQSALGSEIVASPFLDRCSVCQSSEVLYVASKNGRIQALSPQSGKSFWRLDLLDDNPDLPAIDLDGSPVVIRENQGAVVRRRVLIPVGLAQSKNSLPVARLYCYEDASDHSKP